MTGAPGSWHRCQIGHIPSAGSAEFPDMVRLPSAVNDASLWVPRPDRSAPPAVPSGIPTQTSSGFGIRAERGQAHRRTSNHAPSIWSDVNGAPVLISKIEIDVAGMLGDADVDRALGTVELRPRLEQIER